MENLLSRNSNFKMMTPRRLGSLNLASISGSKKILDIDLEDEDNKYFPRSRKGYLEDLSLGGKWGI